MDSLLSAELKKRIRSIIISEQTDEDTLRKKFIETLNPDISVLDCGKSLRDYYALAKSKFKQVKTIDINVFEDYPDLVIDICDQQEMKNLRDQFDAIACFSLLEHCYQPIQACENLFNSLKPGGRIIGSAPFLFPRHSPDDLEYQDFFRFTRDAYAILFPKATRVELFPLRGRVTTSLNVLTTRYRFTLERKFPFLTRKLNKISSKGRQSLQSSGYGFIIDKKP